MAVAERASQLKRVPFQPAEISEARSPVARLVALHAEATDTARLANLLGRSIRIAIALIVGGGAALVWAGSVTVESTVWSGFVFVAAGAIVLAWRRTIGQPFERVALKSFSQNLDAIMAFAGTAWGAGAFYRPSFQCE